jgi:hypothetical protein
MQIATSLCRNQVAAKDPVAGWICRALNQSRIRARRRKIAHTLDKTAIYRLIETRTCAYCKQDLVFNNPRGIHTSASLDQIIPGLGYTEANTVACCWGCNGIKSTATSAQLRQIADGIDQLILTRGLHQAGKS